MLSHFEKSVFLIHSTRILSAWLTQFVRGFQSLPHFPGAYTLTQLARPFFKSLFPFPSFLFRSLLRYFRQSPILMPRPAALIQPINLSWFKQISKDRFYQFNRRFLSKTNFDLWNPFTNRLFEVMRYFPLHT